MNKLSRWDRFLIAIAPKYGVNRIRARVTADQFARNYEAAQMSRRTTGWQRNRGDANSVIRLALAELRIHARDLIRNNAWARRGQRVIANNTVSWGIVPSATGAQAQTADRLWEAWAGSTECESEGRLTFAGIQHLAMKSIVESGEVLIRRRQRRPSDGLTLPLQIEILEADMLDTSQDGLTGPSGGPIILGVEYDRIGRRAAYWIFDSHPGSSGTGTSRPVPASEILHVYDTERPGQTRGVSWFAPAIVNLKDLDEYDDAELMKQKIAACFAAFVTDDGSGASLGEESEDIDLVETFEPGMIQRLPAGKEVTFGTPPSVTEGGFAQRNLRRVASALGVTYEDLTNDYSQVNFSSARMSRISHWGNVYHWQYNMLIPLLCDGVWRWAMEAAAVAGLLDSAPAAEWTVPPMPMIEPDKEGLAYSRLVRNGVMTHNEMVRERGKNPKAHWTEYAAGMATLDVLKIKLDSDVRAVSAAGLTQERVGAGGQKPPPAEE